MTLPTSEPPTSSMLFEALVETAADAIEAGDAYADFARRLSQRPMTIEMAADLLHEEERAEFLALIALKRIQSMEELDRRERQGGVRWKSCPSIGVVATVNHRHAVLASRAWGEGRLRLVARAKTRGELKRWLTHDEAKVRTAALKRIAHVS